MQDAFRQDLQGSMFQHIANILIHILLNLHACLVRHFQCKLQILRTAFEYIIALSTLPNAWLVLVHSELSNISSSELNVPLSSRTVRPCAP